MPFVSLAACFMAGAATGVARGLKHIGPIVEDRLKNSNRYRDEKAEEPVCSCLLFLRIEVSH